MKDSDRAVVVRPMDHAALGVRSVSNRVKLAVTTGCSQQHRRRRVKVSILARMVGHCCRMGSSDGSGRGIILSIVP